MDGSAIITHGCCACAGMLLLPHPTHQHLSRVCACLAGARTTRSCLLRAVRQWRSRGYAAAVQVLLDARIDACCCHGLLAAIHSAHEDY